MHKLNDVNIMHTQKRRSGWNIRRAAVTAFVAGALVISSSAFGYKGPTLENYLRGIGVPTTAISYQYRDVATRNISRVISFFLDPYCNTVLNPPFVVKGMYVVRSDSRDPKGVGMAFLRKAARDRGVDLAWFDKRFLEELARVVGEELLRREGSGFTIQLNKYAGRVR